MNTPVRGRLRSFRHAGDGLRTLVRTQWNARIHLAATITVGVMAAVLRVPAHEWLWLVAAAGAVWTAEAFNTALEFLADEVSLQQRERIGHAKDLAAAAVLCAATGAAVIGLIILGPRVIALLR